MGVAKIGTTGRGIGPAYEDKVGRRAIRVNDLADGNYIRAGYDAELDRLRSLTTDNKSWLAELERIVKSTFPKNIQLHFASDPAAPAIVTS